MLKYRSPVEHATVTISFPRFSARRATSSAATTFAPDEIPAKIPSSFANRRAIAPRGIAGGGDALPGINRVVRADGRVEDYPACASVEMQPGDRFVVETPGGGGFGGGMR